MKTCDQVRTRAATFYARNHRAWLAGDFSPLTVNLLPPTGRAAELDEGRAVQAWIQEWKRSRITAEWEEKKLGYLGTYALPARVVLDSPATAARVAGRAKHWLRINTLLDGFAASLGDDVRSPLINKLAAWEAWDDATVARFVSVVRWLRTHDPSAYYIRELPIFGVDSKWVEAHRAVLTAVVGELGFRDKPVLVELRSLDASVAFCGVRHWSCPLSELIDLPAHRVLFVENHHTFLALPDMPDTIAIFSSGLLAQVLAKRLPWLASKEVLYWGDLDSYGFYILDTVRKYLPHTRSILMDIDTARDHDALAVEEPNPSRFTPARLSATETDALDYLRSHSAGGCLRIEQERIVFDYAVERLRDG
ncbi:Wadjet anti-phage system protein JetD domain-containing protein [Corynebacterium hadale]|uniref:Wadjet anti-phage system protein JetD domain-containing protein n=1 Tax=Corynebacterium hadale TaxID=2026255 RepID=UPI000BAA475E|nr:Wadjet anti-phage system protein JetD domain-containing protein [Corynebacterium hadale]PAT07755.1 hypothetical protein CKJ82_08890 [Corynebacterium hadale]